MCFAQRLKDLRKAKKIKQKELGELLGYTEGAISVWEHGRATPPIPVINGIASVLGTTSDYLLGYSDDPEDWEAIAADLDIPQAIWDISENAEDAVKRYQAIQDDQEREAALSQKRHDPTERASHDGGWVNKMGTYLDTGEQAIIDTYRTLNDPGKEAAYAAVQGIAANPKFQSECDNAGLDSAQQAI